MPNREELACLICKDKDKWTCRQHPSEMDGCKIELQAADRVIEAGWKSPEDCNACIDESAERVSKLIQSQGHSG